MPRGDRSVGTREALLRAGARIFVSRGPYGARVRDIAEAAGLTVPALYYHFEGTGALYEQVVQDGRARFVALIQPAFDTPGAARDRLLAVARGYVGFGHEDPVRLRLLCLELFRPQATREPDAQVQSLTAWLRTGIEAIIADGVHRGELPGVVPALARRLFEAVLNGLLLEQASEPETPLLDDVLAERAVGLFVDGLRGISA
jgi:AcrR family transcriptional regulator